MSQREFDENGWYEVKKNPLSRVGVYPYRGAMIDPSGEFGLDPEEIYNVYRPAEELSNSETIESFKLIPWIDDHDMLGDDAGFISPTEKGVGGVIGEEVFFENGTLFGNLKLFGGEQAGRIDDGKSELSCGYRCKYEKRAGVFGDSAYDFVQTMIRGNHLATVDAGRMGPEVAVLDQLTFTVDHKDFQAMAKKTTLTLDSIAKDGIGADGAAIGDALQVMASAIVGLQTSAMDEEEEKRKLAEDEEEEKRKLAEDEEEDKEKGEDEEEEEKGEDEEEEKEKGEDEYEDKEKGAGMDALEKQVSSLQGDVRNLRKSGFKRFMRETRKRDALVEKTSQFIGTFDAAEMTVEEVAVYACDKLDLKPSKGQEVAALEGFFHNRTPSRVAFGLDSGPRKVSGSDLVVSYLKGD